MKPTYTKILFLTLAPLFLLSLENCCYSDDCCYDCYGKVWGLKPVYSTNLEDIVKLEDPKPLRNPGKIYSYKHYLLVNERNKGLHIINNADPSNPVPLHFLEINGSNDVAIKNDVIYADQFNNLIVISLDSLSNVLEKRLLTDVFENSTYWEVAPEEKDVYYECPNPSLGVVVDWVEDSVEYACYHY